MQVKPCRTYHGKTVGHSLVRMRDGRSAFKVYYISVVGRDAPERFEWERCPRTYGEFEQAILDSGVEGVGFIIAFPHVAKIFRFSPGGETVLDVREHHTEGLRAMDCSRSDGFHEFACYAEAVLAAAEFHAWAHAGTIEEYLGFRAKEDDFPVARHTKLAEYWERA